MNLPSSHIRNRRGSGVVSLIPTGDLCTLAPKKAAHATTTTTTTAAPSKSKRVRTGCLTCRERHLKCDEALPDCRNCRRSNRQCKRGVRLNFIDLQVKKPPCLLPPSVEWSVQFQDESRQIASGYVGGLSRYAHLSRGPDTSASPRRHSNANSRPHHPQHQPSDAGRSAAPNPSLDPATDSFPPMSPAPATPVVYGYSSHVVNSEPSFSAPQSLPHAGAYDFPLPDHHPFTALREEATMSHSRSHRSSDASNAASMTPLLTGQSPTFRGLLQGQGQGHLAGDGMMTPPAGDRTVASERENLNSADDVLYMQVFVREVGVWMDSLDKGKHFSRLLPYRSLKSPMLLHALLACGVRHLALTSRDFLHSKAQHHHDTATTQLLRNLQNPDRDTAECAATAVVLNAYEMMAERPGQQPVRTNHIAGARALIQECGWDARSTDLGAACFWLNMSMEVLSCLAFERQISWDPDHWGGPDLGCFGSSPGKLEPDDGAVVGGVEGLGQEEEWARRIFYIVAKVINFRATTRRPQEASPHDEQARLGQRLGQWHELKRLCDRWSTACPPTMRPLGQLSASQSETTSCFPNIWLINPVAAIGRLVYHTAQCLLVQTNPMEPARAYEETRVLQLHHAHQVCGLMAHNRDRGVASVATRCIAVAGPVLTNPREQDEVMNILKQIHSSTGWDLGTIMARLRRAWGWATTASDVTIDAGLGESNPNVGVGATNNLTFDGRSGSAAPLPVHGSKVNPLSFADVSLSNHLYQNWYEPPTRSNSFSLQGIL